MRLVFVQLPDTFALSELRKQGKIKQALAELFDLNADVIENTGNIWHLLQKGEQLPSGVINPTHIVRVRFYRGRKSEDMEFLVRASDIGGTKPAKKVSKRSARITATKRSAKISSGRRSVRKPGPRP